LIAVVDLLADFQRTPRAPKSAEPLAKRFGAPHEDDSITNNNTNDDQVKSSVRVSLLCVLTLQYTLFGGSDLQSEPTKATTPVATEAKEHQHPDTPPSDDVAVKKEAEAAALRIKIPPPQEASLEHRILQRQKQIDIGKNTPEYVNYRRMVPK
jgi:hypothetical protein